MGSQIRDVQGRLEMWLQFPLPGGWVCAEPDDSTQDGMCGMPVESEPCNIHHPRAVVDRLIEASSLGTPEAKALRESVPDDVARVIVERSKQYADEPEAVIDPGEGLLT